MATPTDSARIQEAKEALRTVKEISDLLNTGLNDDTLKICVQLLEAGVNAEALAAVILELRKATEAAKH
jgi:mitotic-spindle organizing protein 1